ncbi:MAG: hypothetical protein RJA81_2215 [Planctomycetota bacterium]
MIGSDTAKQIGIQALICLMAWLCLRCSVSRAAMTEIPEQQVDRLSTNRPVSTKAVTRSLPTDSLAKSVGLSAAVLVIGGVVILIGRKAAELKVAKRVSGNFAFDEHKPKITGRLRLTNRQMIHLMEVGERVLVLGTGESGAPVLLTQWQSGQQSANSTADQFGLSEEMSESDSEVQTLSRLGVVEMPVSDLPAIDQDEAA